ncbi:MAG: 2-C-methyl-D-erythritol 2,4-cyclodiphosphate synthase [Gemmatimonadota bacterium]|nr:MAG: 2-C-methyl-D-erythritol 2,4-cyclodiphosphate synthase [Gemmatimonadota bacterium]
MVRIGFGYDVHKLVEGRTLVLGGVTIPFEKGLSGHSDADVLCHAICDALLGAAALGDIGQHFPDSDPRYTNISSLVFLEKVSKLLIDEKFTVENIDTTIVAQEPIMAPHIPLMRQNIANSLKIEVSKVSIKASTTEGLGFSGQGLGMVAYAIALVEKD